MRSVKQGPFKRIGKLVGHGLVLAMVGLGVAGCPSEETPTVSAILPLTGELSIYGESIQRGLDLAVIDLRANPDAVEFNLTVVDSAGDPETAGRLLLEQYTAGAVAAIGGVTTDEALAMVPIADESQRVLLSPSASGAELTGASAKFYRVVPSDAKEGATMATFATQKLELEEIAILSSASSYAVGIRDAFSSQFQQLGGKVSEVIEVPAGGDVAAAVEQVVALNPKGVYVAGYVSEIESLLVALRSTGYDLPVLTTSAFALPDVIARIGEPTRRVYLTQMVFNAESDDPKVRAFADAYRAAYNSDPDVYAAQAYDSMMVLAEALKELGPVAGDFWRAVRGIRDFVGVGGVLQFDERGDAQRFHRVHVIQKAEIVDFEVIEKQRAEIRRKLEAVRKRQRAGG